MNDYSNYLNTPSISICKDNYASKEDMWKDIANICNVLTRNQKKVLITLEDSEYGIYRIDYEYDPQATEEDWGSDRFMTVTSDEEDYIIENRKAAKNMYKCHCQSHEENDGNSEDSTYF